MTSRPLMYSGAITYADYLIATADELAIEAEAVELANGKGGGDFDVRARASLADALRRIDEAKVGGSYETMRERLRAVVRAEEAETGVADRMRAHGERMAKLFATDQFNEWARNFSNFLAGLNSPDNDQRKRFQELYDQHGISEWDTHDNPALFAAVVRAKMRKGRPSVSPAWRNENQHLDIMRTLCATGRSIPDAARSVANAEGMAHSGNRAGYFERLYRAKMKLRGQ